MLVLVICLIAVNTFAGEAPIRLGPPQKESRVPAWDARGLGPLPWQGIACADLSADGRFVALGTIAPPGDMNVFLLDANGELVRQHSAGRRWINEVAAGDAGAFAAALCTTPTGQAGDRVALSVFAKDPKPEELNPDQPVFHYGANSNHLSPCVSAMGETLAALMNNGVRWSTPAGAEKPSNTYVPGIDRAMVFAASPAGLAVVATVTPADDAGRTAPNLFLLKRGEQRPVASIAPVTAVEAPPKLEPGEYGPHTPPYEDLPVYGALSVAVDPAGKRFAAACYQGWERTFNSGASFGVRFMPARPAICIYDEKGTEIRRFDPKAFDRPIWCDLAFSPDGTRLYAWPHNWTARGLAGQTILPADGRANRLLALGVDSGGVQAADFPDAIADLSVRPDGGAAVSCWNGRVYVLDAQLKPAAKMAEGIDVGGPALVKAAADGRILVAGTGGIVRMLGPDGAELWNADLNKLATPGDKPWTRNQKAGKIGEGVWRTNGGLAHSDMGGQYVIEAPDGLIMIDPNGGLSIEQNWANIVGAGLDPMKLRYVLLTHEHGDHSPAAYLWRVITGAQVVAGKEAAYSVRHHLPEFSGYGFHPPIPTDVVIGPDRTVDMAGLQVQCIRLAGHTYGSMGYVFEKGGKRYVSIGDVIMPGGTLGYSGSLSFSAEDVMASLHKLVDLKPDYVLGGHGQGEPADFGPKGIEVGEATGWNKMEPSKPDPFYSLGGKNYIVAAWRQSIRSACYPDVNNDGKPDIAILSGGAVSIYLNKGGAFDEQPSITVPLPGAQPRGGENKFRWGHLNDDRIPDLFPSNDSAQFVLLSRDGKPEYDVTMFETTRPTGAYPVDLNSDGLNDLVVGGRFVGSYSVIMQTAPGKLASPQNRQTAASYFDTQLVDLTKDGKDDLVLSNGEVFLRQADGSLANAPALKMKTPDVWCWGWAADFNNDGWPEYAQVSNKDRDVIVSIFENTRDPGRPFKEQPDRTFSVPTATVLRDGPTAADWNSDGVPDLVLLHTKEAYRGAIAVILLGGTGGLNADRAERVALGYTPHHDTKVGVADFSGDGQPDLASFGATRVGASGVYVWLSERGKRQMKR